MSAIIHIGLQLWAASIDGLRRICLLWLIKLLLLLY